MKNHQSYIYEDAFNAVRTIYIIHFLFVIVQVVFQCLDENLFEVFTKNRIWFSIATIILVALGHHFFKWSKVRIMVVILISYIGILLLELSICGIPPPLFTFSGMGKGFILELFFYIVPFIYLGLRVLSIGFLIRLIYLREVYAI